MREILFRGKRKTDGIWLHGDLRQWSETRKGICDYSLRGTSEVDMETVGQYTGLTDKNGQKIFEGDVLEIVMPLHGRKPITERTGVYFDNGCFCVDWNNSSTRIDSFSMGAVTFEIIGNIHDNPELLEG